MFAENGVQSSDRILSQFQAMMHEAYDLQKEIDEYFSSHESAIRDRVSLVDSLQQQLAEERRLLEIQHHECRTQASHARKKQNIIRSEVARVEQTLADNVATLERDEIRIDRQLAAVDERIHEIRQLTTALDERLAKVSAEEHSLTQRERTLVEQEGELVAAAKELKLVEHEIDSRRRQLQQREGTISEWHRGLDAREAEINRCQLQYRENLRRIEQEETLLGINMAGGGANGGAVAGSGADRFGMPAGGSGGGVSQHQVLDNHGMDIIRDDDCEEIDND